MAVKVLAYTTAEEAYLVDREVAAMKAVQGKSNIVSLLSENSYAIDGVEKKFVVMR